MPVMTKENRPKMAIPKGAATAMNKAQAKAMQAELKKSKKVKKK